MNRNIFFSILLSICLVAAIVLIVVVANYSPPEDNFADYEGAEPSDYSEEFSLNGFYYSKVTNEHLVEYYTFNALICEKDDKSFVKNVVVDSTDLAIGDILATGDVIGVQQENFIKCESDGVILDITNMEDDQLIVYYTDQSALCLKYDFSQDEIGLFSYETEIEIELGNHKYAIGYIDSIDYQGIHDSKITATFHVSESFAQLFPGYTIEARIVTSKVYNALCVERSFFESYSLVSNKVFEVYYITAENGLEKTTIRTGDVYDNKVIIFGNNISEDMILYMKGEI